MRPVSDGYLRTIRGSHFASYRARIVTDFPTGTNPVGTEIPILSGDVMMDANADVRATLDMTTEGKGMWPSRASSLFAPYGNEVFVESGVQVGAGATEWVSHGYFRIQAPEQDDAPDGPIRIAGQDRMAGIRDSRLPAPVQFTAGTSNGTVVSTLVLDVYPGAVIEWDDSTNADLLARSHIAEEDRYGFLNELITALGKIWYWDYRGVLKITTPPDPTQSVFDVNAGEDGVLVEMSRQLSREGVYNGVVAMGEAADTTNPVRVLVVDNNPASPTYWHGENTSGRTFGKVPRFFSSPFITTETQALSAGTSLLQQKLGLPYSVDFTSVPNSALEPLDPVRVAGELHIIERLRMPLTSDQALTGSTREQKLIVIGQA